MVDIPVPVKARGYLKLIQRIDICLDLLRHGRSFIARFQADQFADILALFYHFLQAIADGKARPLLFGQRLVLFIRILQPPGQQLLCGVHHIAAIGIELVFPV